MQFWATVLLDGLTYASYLFIVSLGLAIRFGVMKILFLMGTFMLGVLILLHLQ